MKKLNLLVEIKLERIIKSPLKDVLVVEANSGLLGYVEIERDVEGDEISITPFTSDGLLDETHCTGCAIKALAEKTFRTPSGLFDLAETSEQRSRPFTGLLTGVLSGVTKH